jgi:hypothetical protein
MAVLVPDALGALERLLEPNVDERLQLLADREVLRLGAYTSSDDHRGLIERAADDELTRHGIDGVIAAARQEQLASPSDDAERYAV